MNRHMDNIDERVYEETLYALLYRWCCDRGFVTQGHADDFARRARMMAHAVMSGVRAERDGNNGD